MDDITKQNWLFPIKILNWTNFQLGRLTYLKSYKLNIIRKHPSALYRIILTGSGQVKIIAGFRGIPTFNATDSKPGFIKLKLEQNGVDTSRREPFHALTVL